MSGVQAATVSFRSSTPPAIKTTIEGGDYPARVVSSSSVVVPFPKSGGRVAILLCTFDGQRFLSDQLESLRNQTYADWELWVSDDGSQDRTRVILESFRTSAGVDRSSIHNGPAEGFVANFLSLVCHASITADYYAFSDQDDVWEPEKLERAVNWLKSVPQSVPALYCSRTRLVDAENNEIGLSPLFPKSPSFANALTQNVGGGNTMVFNHAARELIRQAGDNVDVVAHDWWAYLVVTGCGGQVFYDPVPSIRYRQHENNLIGVDSSWPARLVRLGQMLKGRFSQWTDRNVEALQRVRVCLTPENREMLDHFSLARKRWLIPRLLGLKSSGVYRQTLFGNLGLLLAALFKKV